MIFVRHRVCVVNCGASNDVHDVESQRVNDCEQSHRRDDNDDDDEQLRETWGEHIGEHVGIIKCRRSAIMNIR